MSDLEEILCCKKENVCPYCGNKRRELLTEYILEVSAYKEMRCLRCRKIYAVPYLIEFDEERPENQMKIAQVYSEE